MQLLIGAIILFFALLCVGVMLAFLGAVVMLLMHRLLADRLPAQRYHEFDFDQVSADGFQHMDKRVLLDFATRMAIAFVGTTWVLHMAVYLLVPRSVMIRHGGVVLFMLFVMETVAIAVALFKLFELDAPRLAILTASTALFYLVFLWFMQWEHMLL
jgi:hypothetical protein